MRPVHVCSALLILTASAALAQTFEVASIKPAAPPTTSMGGGGRMMMTVRARISGGPGTSDPGQIMYSGQSIQDLLAAAYGVKSYQVTGPAWLNTERFDIVAKVPQGATKDDVKPMLQNLLADRFKVTLHREKKDLPMYALIVAKNGPKMKESAPDDPDAKDAGSAKDPGSMTAAETAAAQKNMEKLATAMSRGETPPPTSGGRPGNSMIMMPGRARMTVTKESMARFVEMLSGQLNKPVVDMTGLTKLYDFSLEYLPENTGGRGLMPPPAPSGDGAAPPEAEAAPDLFTAIQAQLGLKLEQRKAPVDMVIVDHAEKTPAEN